MLGESVAKCENTVSSAQPVKLGQVLNELRDRTELVENNISELYSMFMGEPVDNSPCKPNFEFGNQISKDIDSSISRLNRVNYLVERIKNSL